MALEQTAFKVIEMKRMELEMDLPAKVQAIRRQWGSKGEEAECLSR